MLRFLQTDEVPVVYISPSETEDVGWNVSYEGYSLMPDYFDNRGYLSGVTVPTDEEFEYSVAFVDKNLQVIKLATWDILKQKNDIEGAYQGFTYWFPIYSKSEIPHAAVATAVVYRRNSEDAWKIIPAYNNASNFSPIDGSTSKYADITWDVPNDILYDIQDNVSGGCTNCSVDKLPKKLLSNMITVIKANGGYGKGWFEVNGVDRSYYSGSSEANPSVIIPNRNREQTSAPIHVKFCHDAGDYKTACVDGINYVIDPNTHKAKTAQSSQGQYKGVNNLVIPSKISVGSDEYTVTEIGEKYFAQSDAQNISIPSSVEKIGISAFQGVEILSVKFDKNSECKIIEQGALYEYKGNELILPEKLERLEGWNFSYYKFNKVELPQTLKYIGTYCFVACANNTQSVEVIASWLNPSEVVVDPGIFDSNATQCWVRNRILRVPKGTKALYEQIEPWKNFQMITEYDNADIEEIYEDIDNSSIEYFTLGGLYMGKDRSKLARGVYIIRKGNKSFKTIIE